MSVAAGQAPDWKQWEGESVDGFPLQDLLGKGEKSAVFRTTFESADAVIKLVPAAGAQADALIEQQVEQWERAQALDDPHFIRILKAGSSSKSGSPLAYAVMEYAEENLATVLADRPLSPGETADLIPPLAEALAALHRQGLAHGRVKPSNVLAVNDTLKLSSDCVAIGAGAQDLRGLAELIVQALTQRTDALSRGDSESRINNGVPPDLAEIVRNCGGHNGRAQWSATELLSWLASPRRTLPAASVPAPVRAAESRGPKLTRLAMGLGLIVVVVLVVGGMLKSRSADPAAPVSTTAAPPAIAKPVGEAPSTLPPAPPKPKEKPAVVATPRVEAAGVPEASGQVALQVLPSITDKARKTVHGTVVIKIQVRIDPSSGEVTDATLLPTGSRYLGKLALEAARKWRFAPGSPSASLLRFVITNEDTKVSVERSR